MPFFPNAATVTMNYCTQNDIAGDQNNNYYPVLPQNGAAYPPGTLAHQIFNYSSTNPNGAVNNPQTYFASAYPSRSPSGGTYSQQSRPTDSYRQA